MPDAAVYTGEIDKSAAFTSHTCLAGGGRMDVYYSYINFVH